MTNPELDHYYQILNLPAGSSLEEVEQAYLSLVGQKLRQGAKSELTPIKNAYNQLKEYLLLQGQQQAEAVQQAPQKRITEAIQRDLEAKKLQAEINWYSEHLEVIFKAKQAPNAKITTALIYNIVHNLDLGNITRVKVCGVGLNQRVIWQQEFTLDQNPEQIKDVRRRSEVLLAEAERKTRIFAYPTAILIAMIINIAQPIAWFIGMWMHELGHASVAWFAGYQAIITLGGTLTSDARSLFVYFGLLFLLGLLFWYSWREQKRFTMILAVGLAILQFILTWVISRDTYEMLMTFGGIGGEFYLSTFFMVSFYFRFPEKFYWDFWRYLVLIFASTTFWQSFWMWHRIKKGSEDIPWGSMWGGRGDAGGDMDILSSFGWSDRAIINTYSHLGNLCLFILIGVYLYFLTQSNPRLWFDLQQKLLGLFYSRK